MAAAGAGLAAWLVVRPAHLSEDTSYALVWGRDLINGHTPAYGVPFAPTPHPLATAAGALASVLGRDGAISALIVVSFLGFGGLLVAVVMLGRELFSLPAGLVAALAVCLSFAYWGTTAFASLDIVAFQLVVWAAVLEAQKPRRGLPVLALLAVASLQRPDILFLAGAYALWLAPGLPWRGRITLVVPLLLPVLIWAGNDLLGTGAVNHSYSYTSHAAQSKYGHFTIGEILTSLPTHLRDVVRLPGLVAASLGIGVALVVARARAVLPLAICAISVVGFIALGVMKLPLLSRYLMVSGAMLAVFIGFGAVGWFARPPDRLRRLWMVIGALVFVALASLIPVQVDRIRQLRSDVHLQLALTHASRSLAHQHAAGPLLSSCGPIYLGGQRNRAFLAYYLGRPLEDFRVAPSLKHAPAGATRPRTGLILAASSEIVARYFKGRAVRVPHGFHRVASNGSWRLYERACRPHDSSRWGGRQ